MFVMAFHDTYGMPVNITRCSNNYGPYQFPEKLIPLMINNVKHHKQLPIYGDGMQIRDWLYVEDHCKAIDMVANGGKIGEVYNVGGHNERPNIFIVKTIINQLHDRLQDEGISADLIKHVADRLGHDRRYGIDPTKIKNDLGGYPETPFEKGIVLTIDWYLNLSLIHIFTKPGRVSILIPSCDHSSDLRTCVESIYRRSTYEDLEIIVIENNSREPATFRCYEKLQKEHKNLKVITWQGTGFNYSALNNFGAKAVSYTHLDVYKRQGQLCAVGWPTLCAGADPQDRPQRSVGPGKR